MVSSLGMCITCQQVLLLIISRLSTCTLAADITAATTIATATATGAADPDPTVSVLLKAGSLAWTVVSLLGIGVFRVIMLVLWPVFAIVSLLWRMLVVAPLQLFISIVHVLYPVVLFCFAAVLCGAIIGGCAGFAAEAISWFTITATWGRQTPRKSSVPAIDPYDHDDHSIMTYENHDVGDYTDDDDAAAAAITEHTRVYGSKGKQPLRRPPSPHRYTASPPEQRFNTEQAMADEYPEDEWAWGDEEDLDAFPRRRRWRRSVG